MNVNVSVKNYDTFGLPGHFFKCENNVSIKRNIESSFYKCTFYKSSFYKSSFYKAAFFKSPPFTNFLSFTNPNFTNPLQAHVLQVSVLEILVLQVQATLVQTTKYSMHCSQARREATATKPTQDTDIACQTLDTLVLKTIYLTRYIELCLDRWRHNK